MNRAATFLTMAIFIFPAMAWANEITCAAYHIGCEKDAQPLPTVYNSPIPDTSWHLLTVSHSGTVSLIDGLSEDGCEKASSQVLHWVHLCKIMDSSNHCKITYGPSIIDRAECFQ